MVLNACTSACIPFSEKEMSSSIAYDSLIERERTRATAREREEKRRPKPYVQDICVLLLCVSSNEVENTGRYVTSARHLYAPSHFVSCLIVLSSIIRHLLTLLISWCWMFACCINAAHTYAYPMIIIKSSMATIDERHSIWYQKEE